ncbi:hypothetical protein GCM10027416_18640 [Okibacterium endophyticum]
MAHADITLIGKPDCHLCDDARVMVQAVVAELSADPDAPQTSVTELSILDDRALYAKYWEEIPVVLVNGRMHTYWRVDPTRLATAIRDAQGAP